MPNGIDVPFPSRIVLPSGLPKSGSLGSGVFVGFCVAVAVEGRGEESVAVAVSDCVAAGVDVQEAVIVTIGVAV